MPNPNGAPLGNQYAAKAKVWSAAIQRALAERSRVTRKEALDDLANKLLDMCAEGDLAALKELGDRLEGKPVQGISGPGPDGEILVNAIVKYVNAGN